MPLRNATPVTLRPQGVTDAVDGTNTFPGALTAAVDIIPALHTKSIWVPRPAAFSYIDFSSFGSNVRGEELSIVGHRVYGVIAGGTAIPGHSVPFLYDVDTRAFLPIAGVTAENTPISAPATGDWTPPTAVPVGAYLLFSHPGFSLPNAFGWLDMTGFSATATGDTGYTAVPMLWGSGIWGSGIWGGTSASGGTVIANLSVNAQLAGWRPGQIITDSAGVIPRDTRIASVSVDGTALTLTRSTTGAVRGDALTVFGGSPDNPLWAAGNTSVNPLPFVATAVSQFNGRAEFAVKSAIAFSDSLDPLTRTNANQVLTFDNGLNVTAFATIPFQTTAGGIIQSLLAVQGDEAIQQITGDPATGNLSKNLLSQIGTLSPNAIVSTPEGVLFIAPDGIRLVNQTGTVSPALGTEGDGVALPFVNAIYPTRICAAYNEDIIRVSVTYNETSGGSAIANVISGEFWFHLKLKAWSGPHTFSASLIASLDLRQTRHGHLMFPLDPAAKGIWFSNTRPMIDSAYVENGKPLRATQLWTLSPDTQSMFMAGVNETTVMMSQADPVDLAVADESGSLLGHVQVLPFQAPAGVWGSMIWGMGRWGGDPVPDGVWGKAIWGQSLWGGGGAGGATLAQRLIPWDHEIVFKQAQLLISAPSSPRLALGNVYMRYQKTGYTIADTGPFVTDAGVFVPGSATVVLPPPPPSPPLPPNTLRIGGYAFVEDPLGNLLVVSPDGSSFALVRHVP